MLLTGYEPPRLVWLGMQLGTTFGVAFVHWLIVALILPELRSYWRTLR
ncbi:hypothetical protein M8542_48740 [Amycolatopsis sp. OK19-0408]|uniref:Uncharacterized protein n=1 Tax=Amycolatopsis iheyensis TaxID=2945988 RepID=A0A9X2NKW9_9PSEU|nr:hypothetical protein [Amycolatopsis iheyensis]MCR6490711.1 hypothetical protein [Amycolatopsis iheyensis]